MRARALNKKKLLATLTPHLPVEYQSADKKEQLEKNLVRWRKEGTFYVFLAGRLGLGSLVHLLRFIQPGKSLWGTSLGNEVSGISAKAFKHLESVGLPGMARQSGADDFMHDLLWAVFVRFEGFPSRKGKEPFLGFDYVGLDYESDDSAIFVQGSTAAGGALEETE